MATPTAVFPGSIATDAQLKVANNLIQNKLRVAVDAVNTILFVDSTAGFGANMLVSIDKEIIAISGIQTSPDAALIVASGGRGFDGTTAATHAAGAKVSVYIDAWHHNVLSAEVKAIQAALGPNLQNVGKSVYLISTDFLFAPQTPGGTLNASVNVINLAPVPKGVNGTDTNHYLYISGGTGTAEAVVITGGTAVSGAASGTVIVNCANAHSGAWTIQSATAGIQEAVQYLRTASSSGRIVIPAGAHTLYGPVHVSGTGGIYITGLGMQASTLFNVATDSSDIFRFSSSTLASGGGISDLSIIGFNPRPGGWALYLDNQNYFFAANLFIVGPPNGIRVINSGHFIETVSILNLQNSNGAGFGNAIQIDSTGAPVNYLRNVFVGGGTVNAGIVINSGGYLVLVDSAFTGANYGMLVTPLGEAVLSMELVNVQFDNNLLAGILFQPRPAGTIARSRFTGCWTTSCHNGPGIAISGGAGTVIEGLSFVHHQASDNQQDGVAMVGAGANIVKGITFDQLIASGNNKAGSTYSGVDIGQWVSQIAIRNSAIGPFADFLSDGQANAIKVNATVDKLIITGNSFTGAGTQINDASANVNKVIANNLGIDNAPPPTVASAATIALPTSDIPTIKITGTSTVTTINGGWTGRRIRLAKPDPGSVTIGGAGNVPGTHTLAQNGGLDLVFDGAIWY